MQIRKAMKKLLAKVQRENKSASKKDVDSAVVAPMREGGESVTETTQRLLNSPGNSSELMLHRNEMPPSEPTNEALRGAVDSGNSGNDYQVSQEQAMKVPLPSEAGRNPTPVEIPRVRTPGSETPKVSTPTPRVETPRVESPKVELPEVVSPAVERKPKLGQIPDIDEVGPDCKSRIFFRHIFLSIRKVDIPKVDESPHESPSSTPSWPCGRGPHPLDHRGLSDDSWPSLPHPDYPDQPDNQPNHPVSIASASYLAAKNSKSKFGRKKKSQKDKLPAELEDGIAENDQHRPHSGMFPHLRTRQQKLITSQFHPACRNKESPPKSLPRRKNVSTHDALRPGHPP